MGWPDRLDQGWRVVDRLLLDRHDFVYARFDAWSGTRWAVWVDGRRVGLAAWFWWDEFVEVDGKTYRIQFRRRLAPFRRRFIVAPTVADVGNPRWLRRMRKRP